MASAHLTDAELHYFRGKRLSAKQLAATSQHLQECDACAGRLRTGWQAPAAPALANEVQHLSYEDMTSVLDHSADARRQDWVEEHSRVCAACSRQLHELQELDTMLAQPSVEPVVAEPRRQRPTEAAPLGWGFWGWVNASLAAALAVGLVVLATASRTRPDAAAAAISNRPASGHLFQQPVTAGALVLGVVIVFLLLLVTSRRRRNRNGKKRS